jgi:hypothetical protein
VGRIISRLFGKVGLVIISLLLISSGCTAAGGEGLAVFLTQGDVPPAQLKTLNQVEIAEQPLIGMNDIIYYNIQTHELKLTAGAFAQVSHLNVPVRGRSFIVCVDKKPIYPGAFWTPISSLSFDGVTIWKPLDSLTPEVITFELGYPSASFYGGEDPRNSPEILKALEKGGKLIQKLSITDVEKLPRSLKGYELYSWLAANQWHFTIVTGTNRNKSLEEIAAQEDFISETGWVKVQAAGMGKLIEVLMKIPPRETVIWLVDRPAGAAPGNIKLELPPQSIVDEVKAAASQQGLDLVVPVLLE